MKMRNSFFEFLGLLQNDRGEVDTKTALEGNPDDEIEEGGKKEEVKEEEDKDPIYGDLKVEWPEGTEEHLRKQPSLKPFVDKDGKIRTASLLNAYYETKKMVGQDKVVIPKDDAPESEKIAFAKKMGWIEDKAAYVVEKKEKSHLEDRFVEELKEFAHANKVPVSVARKLTDFMEEQAAKGVDLESKTLNQQIENQLAELREEFGTAYEAKRFLARKVITEMVDDSEIAEALKDPRLGSNKHVIKMLAKIGEKTFGEDAFKGGPRFGNTLSPEQADEKIREIYADKNHPYHRGDPAATKEMQKLFKMKG